ncbi:MAG: phosphate signaling complex protein PhoU [Bdellovibrionales bacterium]|nr:phosphate signaling complex protein PhoU [Bdellovibrionales bacterium]
MGIQFQKEVELLKKRLLTLSTAVEEQLVNACTALLKGNSELADQVVAQDENVDTLEVHVEEECLKILALYQPVSTDLRFIVSALKINNDLERIGDLAVGIARRAQFLHSFGKEIFPACMQEMFERTRQMLRKSLNSLVELDVEAARQVCQEDERVDALNREVQTQASSMIAPGSESVRAAMDIIFVAKNLERIADLSTNIAEDVIYVVQGEIVRHGRREQSGR